MIVVSVIYPAASGARFDYDYYMATHIPLVRRLWSGMGLQEVRVLKGNGTPDGGPPPYPGNCIADLRVSRSAQGCVGSAW